jgi:hypothetical protein
MDTRRIAGSYGPAPQPIDHAIVMDVEIVELTAVATRRRGFLGRALFVASVALLAGLIAIAGVPSRSTFALDAPLPNLLSPTAAP